MRSLAFLFAFSMLMLGGQAQAAEFPEPPFEWFVKFEVNEIPGKATVYYDIDGDKVPDLVTAHEILKVFHVKQCKVPMRHEDYILVGSECGSVAPKVYFLARKIFAVRMIDERWAVVTERTWLRCRSKKNVNLECRGKEENVILVPQGD